MNTIYKYILAEVDYQSLNIPAKAQILSVQEQNDYLTIWVGLNTNEPSVIRDIRVFGTGNPVVLTHPDSKLNFIGTVKMPVGLVWHVFEEIDEL